jgi:proline iminopeptidase
MFAIVALFLCDCCTGFSRNDRTARAYLDYSGRDDVFTDGVKMILVHTPKGDFLNWP